MNKNETCELYIKSINQVYSEYAKDAKTSRDLAVGTEAEQQARGYLFAFHTIVSLMVEHAKQYDLSKEDIGLGNIDLNDLT